MVFVEPQLGADDRYQPGYQVPTRNACQRLCVLITQQIIAGPAKADAARLMSEQRKIFAVP